MSGCFLTSTGDPGEITSFSFKANKNEVLTEDIEGAINGADITVEVPVNTDVSNLIATFTITGTKLIVRGVVQESDITPNDFTTPVI